MRETATYVDGMKTSCLVGWVYIEIESVVDTSHAWSSRLDKSQVSLPEGVHNLALDLLHQG